MNRITCHTYQNEASTTATRVAALPIVAAAANLKESSVDDKSFNTTYVCPSVIIILRFSTRPLDSRIYIIGGKLVNIACAY